jgi:UDP-3-O-[3-hydroxymyristoyl] glucosamine N-acyltransferase
MKTLGEIAKFLEGHLHGDAALQIERVVHPALVNGPRDLALLLSASAAKYLASGELMSAILPEEVDPAKTPNWISVKRPRLALARLMELFERPVYLPPGIHPTAVIDPSAKVGKDVGIGPHCWIGPEAIIGDGTRIVSNVSIGANVVLGKKCLIHAGVCIGDRCEIGNRVIIQPNATIGGDGFAFVTPERGSVEDVKAKKQINNFNTEIVRINSIGNVVIEDDVEIGSSTCIDRGTMGETRIGRGSKLDNLIQVGHNASIGQNCFVVALVGLGGSSQLGDRVVMGGQSGLPDHMSVGDDSVVYAQSGISENIPPRNLVGGTPAVPLRDALRREMSAKRLPRMFQELKKLKERVAELESLVKQIDPETAARLK